MKITDIAKKEPFEGLFPLDEKLIDSIVAAGFDQSFPVMIWQHNGSNILIDGFNRLEAANRLGLQEIPSKTYQFATEDEAYLKAWRANAPRRHLKEAQIAARFTEVDRRARAEAERRIRAGGEKGRKQAKNGLGPKGPTPEPRKSIADTAAVLNIPVKKAKKYRAVFGTGEKQAAATKKEQKDLLAGKATLSQVWKAVQERTGKAKPKTTPQQINTGRIIKQFVTNQIQGAEQVVCPHFWELKWANGCHYDCAWCYLKGTYRGQTQFKEKKWNEVISDILAATAELKDSVLLNAGEVADGLGAETPEDSSALLLLGLFAKLKKHRVLFLTKTDEVTHLVNAPQAWKDKAVLSWSLNAHAVAKRWEKDAPMMAKRIAAAKAVHDAGYKVRVRIDPIVPVQGWEDRYAKLIEEIYSAFTPDRVTLGTLRMVNKRICTFTWDREWTRFFKEGSGWGAKMDRSLRKDCYSHIASLCSERGTKKLGVCKETESMIKELPFIGRCNCEE